MYFIKIIFFSASVYLRLLEIGTLGLIKNIVHEKKSAYIWISDFILYPQKLLFVKFKSTVHSLIFKRKLMLFKT